MSHAELRFPGKSRDFQAGADEASGKGSDVALEVGLTLSQGLLYGVYSRRKKDVHPLCRTHNKKMLTFSSLQRSIENYCGYSDVFDWIVHSTGL